MLNFIFKSKPNYIGYDLEGIPKSKLESLRKKGVPIIVWTVKNKEDSNPIGGILVLGILVGGGYAGYKHYKNKKV